MKLYTFIAALFLTACVPAENDSSEPPKSEPTSEPSSSQPASEPSSSSTGGCADEANFNDCAECLVNENPTGYQAYAMALIDNCYCENDCATSCSSFCSDSTGQTAPSSECETCVDGVASDQNSACIQGWSADCGSDANCMAFVEALNTCPQ